VVQGVKAKMPHSRPVTSSATIIFRRSELRAVRHKMTSSSYFAEKGVAPDAAMEELPLGYAESVYSSASFIANLSTRRKEA
jgi:hypothetical protein